MNSYNVVIYKTERYEIYVEAKDEEEARDLCDDVSLLEEDKDPDFYEEEIVDVIKLEDRI